MYVPHFNALDGVPEIQALVMQVGSAQLVTTGPDGYPMASMLPVIWEPAGNRLVMHMAKANQHWKAIEPDTPALAVVTGPEAYVSPAWYATKAEHGKVVPTWNYSAVHFTGRLTLEHDPEWLREAVTWLTELHENRRESAGHEAWSVDDAPDKYVDGQLRAIVGIQLSSSGSRPRPSTARTAPTPTAPASSPACVPRVAYAARPRSPTGWPRTWASSSPG